MTTVANRPPGDLYKFVGSPNANEPEALLGIFDAIFVDGSMKFGTARAFNDPFEFKFKAEVPRSLQMVEDWHAMHDPTRSPEERLNAWTNLQGDDDPATWRTQMEPRRELLGQLYVLCLAQVWDSPLLWAHYASMHKGFCAILDSAALAAYATHQGFGGACPVTYRNDLPTVRWFAEPVEESIQAVVFNKSTAWAYEGEVRVALIGPPGREALYPTIDLHLLKGVILGARATPALINRALAHQAATPGFVVRQITSDLDTYALGAIDVVKDVWRLEPIL